MPRKLSKSSHRYRKGQKSKTYLQNTVCTSASLLLRLNPFSAPKPVNHAVWIYCLANQLLTIQAPLPIKLKLYFKSSTITTTKPPNACQASRQQLLLKIAFKPIYAHSKKWAYKAASRRQYARTAREAIKLAYFFGLGLNADMQISACTQPHSNPTTRPSETLVVYVSDGLQFYLHVNRNKILSAKICLSKEMQAASYPPGFRHHTASPDSLALALSDGLGGAPAGCL